MSYDLAVFEKSRAPAAVFPPPMNGAFARFGDALTVERRVYTDCMSYTHQKAGYLSAGESDEEDCVEIAGNQVRVKRHQILSGGTVQQLFWDFFRQTETADQIGWTEIQL